MTNMLLTRSILGVAVFLSTVFLYGQENRMEENYSKYHQLIDQAEKNIANDKLNIAYTIYDDCFNIYNKPFLKDVFNASVIAYSIGKISEGDSLISISINHGLPYKEIKRNKILKKQFSKTKFDKIILKNRNQYGDEKLKFTLDSLYTLDQKNRSGKISNEKFNKNDSLIFQKLKKIIQEKGFPSDYNIGYKGETLSKAALILLHNANKFDEDFLHGLKKLIRTGEIHPINYANIAERFNMVHYGKRYYFNDLNFINSGNIKYRSKDTYGKLDKSLDTVYARRKKIYLDLPQDFINKNLGFQKYGLKFYLSI